MRVLHADLQPSGDLTLCRVGCYRDHTAGCAGRQVHVAGREAAADRRHRAVTFGAETR